MIAASTRWPELAFGFKFKQPGFAPVYCALYPQLAKTVRAHGYALAIHGSLFRDFDLVCVPWIQHPSAPQDVVDALCAAHWLKQAGPPEQKLHGRIAYMISIAYGECAIDLSFMPMDTD